MRSLFDLPGEPAATRLVVAMSGGVDSSVVAALAARAGFDVVGVTLQLYDAGAATGRTGACCAGADIRDARRVADAIGIPHYVLDFEARFKAGVVDRFADAYAAGETPVPCVDCNKTVKFTDLLGFARDLGAAAVATGHYASTRAGPGGRTLHRAADEGRDQSYFLYATSPAQLERLRFPLGDLPKEETRRIARELGLAVAGKPDSQDICFVPDGRYADVLVRLRPDAMRPGEVVDRAGRVLGRHRGVGAFTVGQRRGIGVAAAEPLYVLALDAERARVVVGPREALGVGRIALRDVNWLGDGTLDDLPAAGLPVAVKVRSARPPRAASLRRAPGGGLLVELGEPEEGVAPGQACVVYDGPDARARVLGGGTIAREARLAAAA